MQKRNLTKEKIIQAAFSLADEIGLNQVTFPKIADKLGIKYPSLYNHFDNMDNLKIEMTKFLFNELNLVLMERLIGKSGEEAIREYSYVYKDFAFKNKTGYGLFLNAASLENEEIYGFARKTIGIIRQILSSYITDPELLTHKSRSLRSLLHGFVSLQLLGYFKNEANPDESFELMIDDFISSIKKED